MNDGSGGGMVATAAFGLVAGGGATARKRAFAARRRAAPRFAGTLAATGAGTLRRCLRWTFMTTPISSGREIAARSRHSAPIGAAPP